MQIANQLEPQNINCIVTSPPYWGLRDYGVEPQIWGGDLECLHEWGEAINCPTKNGTQGSTETIKNASLVDGMGKPKGSSLCIKCGAWLGSLGLEPTPELYVQHLTEIFRALRPALRDDGTLWLNLGDSYAQGGSGGASNKSKLKNDGRRLIGARNYEQQLNKTSITRKKPTYLKPKDLVGIPWMVAFALRADGWYLRSDIIWHKPNAMPESVRDRPTKAHEYIFLLSKSNRYYYDYKAIREAGSSKPTSKIKVPGGWDVEKGAHGTIHRKGRTVGQYTQTTDKQRGHSRRHAGFNDRWDNMTKEEQCSMGRNKRTVWTVATRPFSGAHFAVFPPELIEPCILAGSPPGGTVLDPFGGRGTVAKVAEQHGRNSVYIDLKQEYVDMAKEYCGFEVREGEGCRWSGRN